MDTKTINKIKEGIYKNLSYTNQDFESIMLQMIDIVENNSSENKWNNLTEADPITMLLAIVAAHTDILNYMTDYRILETYMSTARERESMIRIANSFGYKIPGYSASRILYKIVSNKTGTLGTLSSFTTIEDDNGVQWTYTGEDKEVVAGDQIEFFQGYQQQYPFAGTNVPLSNEMIIPGTNIAFSNSYNSNPVASLTYEGPEGDIKFEFVDRSYTRKNNKEVFDFGEDVLGMTYIKFLNTVDIRNEYPLNFSLRYLVTSGDINISQADVTSFDIGQNTVKLEPVEGSFYRGSSGTPTEKIKDGFTNYYAGIDTLVTVKDYENYIKNVQRVIPKIDKVFVLDNQTDSGGGSGSSLVPDQTVAIYATKKNSAGESEPITNQVFSVRSDIGEKYQIDLGSISISAVDSGVNLMIHRTYDMKQLAYNVNSVRLVLNPRGGVDIYTTTNGIESPLYAVDSEVHISSIVGPDKPVKIEGHSEINPAVVYSIGVENNDLRTLYNELQLRKVTGISIDINNSPSPIYGVALSLTLTGIPTNTTIVYTAIKDYLLSKNIGSLVTANEIQSMLVEKDLLKYFTHGTNITFTENSLYKQLSFNEYISSVVINNTTI